MFRVDTKTLTIARRQKTRKARTELRTTQATRGGGDRATRRTVAHSLEPWGVGVERLVKKIRQGKVQKPLLWSTTTPKPSTCAEERRGIAQFPPVNVTEKM